MLARSAPACPIVWGARRQEDPQYDLFVAKLFRPWRPADWPYRVQTADLPHPVEDAVLARITDVHRAPRVRHDEEQRHEEPAGAVPAVPTPAEVSPFADAARIAMGIVPTLAHWTAACVVGSLPRLARVLKRAARQVAEEAAGAFHSPYVRSIMCEEPNYTAIIDQELAARAREAAARREIFDPNEFDMEQRRVAVAVLQRLFDPSIGHMVVQGAGGSGKTFAVKVALAAATRLKWKQRISCLAFTNIAAQQFANTGVLWGTTCSVLGIDSRGNGSASLDDVDAARVVLRGISVLVVDEMSFISTQHLHGLDRRLRAIMKQPDVPFGGVAIILAGDVYQHAPITGDALYKDAARSCFAPFAAYQTYCCNGQHRQLHGDRLGPILARLRAGCMTDDDWDAINSRVLPAEGMLPRAACNAARPNAPLAPLRRPRRTLGRAIRRRVLSRGNPPQSAPGRAPAGRRPRRRSRRGTALVVGCA